MHVHMYNAHSGVHSNVTHQSLTTGSWPSPTVAVFVMFMVFLDCRMVATLMLLCRRVILCTHWTLTRLLLLPRGRRHHLLCLPPLICAAGVSPGVMVSGAGFHV